VKDELPDEDYVTQWPQDHVATYGPYIELINRNRLTTGFGKQLDFSLPSFLNDIFI